MRVSGEEFLRVSRSVPGPSDVDQSRISGAGITFTGAIATAPDNPTTAFNMKTPSTFEIQRVAEIVEGLPDIREDVVESLRARIEAGTYLVSGEQVAEMMVRRFLADQVR